MWWITQCWFGKMFDFHRNLYIHLRAINWLVEFNLCLSISVSFQHGFQGDIYQKLNTSGFSCQQYAAVISVSNLVPTAVVVSALSFTSIVTHSLFSFNYLCINVIWTYTKLTWGAEDFCSCFDSTDCINILHDRIFLSGYCIFWLHMWKLYINTYTIILKRHLNYFRLESSVILKEGNNWSTYYRIKMILNTILSASCICISVLELEWIHLSHVKVLMKCKMILHI